MRVDLLDPPAYSPAYDDALAAALGRAGAEVTLLTSPFAYDAAPDPVGYTRMERFYRRAVGPAGSRARTLTKLAQHLPDMAAYRRSARAQADVAHYEWLTVPRLDLRFLPDIPTVLTIHDPLERGGRTPLAAAAFARVDAVVVHSRYARERVIAQHGFEPARVHVIPHGALPYRPRGEKPTVAVGFSPLDLDSLSAPDRPPAPDSAPAPDRPSTPVPLPPELHDADDGTPVVLCFGLLRPYKGVATLLQAWRGITGAQLWIVGRPMMDVAALREAAPLGARIVPRFATRSEEAALFARADIVVLPYHHSDRFGFSGVLATALGAGKAIVLSDVGGLSEVAHPDPTDPAAMPAARLVPPGDADALRAALTELLADPGARDSLAAAATHAAGTTYCWDRIARQTLDLYGRITAGAGVGR